MAMSATPSPNSTLPCTTRSSSLGAHRGVGDPPLHCDASGDDVGPLGRSVEPSPAAPAPSATDGRESVLRFLLLPSQVGVVLLLELLNSFRSFGFRFVQYNYITNEYGIEDGRAGRLLGAKGVIDIVFGVAGSIFVDLFGVRRVSVAAMSVAIVGRALLAFGRSSASLYAALFLFSPCGDALLSVGLYSVALKKLTTPSTRPLAFAVSYASSNLAGGLAAVLVDSIRGGQEDLAVDEHFIGLAGVYTPLRQFMVVTWVVVLLAFIIAYFFLEDWTVIDNHELEDDDVVQHQIIRQTDGIHATENDGNRNGSISCIDLMPAKPMVKHHILRRWFSNQYLTMHSAGDGVLSPARMPPAYRMYRTQFKTGERGNGPLCEGMTQVLGQVRGLLRLRATWRALAFGFATFAVSANWTAAELLMPPFFERRFGEGVPIYAIQSINLFGCLILPPVVGAVAGGMEDFSVVMPGLWIMALSPIFVAAFPNVAGACMWIAVGTIGEVLWSPRQDSWTAGLAPTGSEGLFFAISSSRDVLGPLANMLMGAINARYNANCPECRDQYGHFCMELNTADDGVLQCSSVQEFCNGSPIGEGQSCPQTCLECPSWEPSDPSACWYLLLLVSILTPLGTWFLLPFLRGKHSRDEGFYGIFSPTRSRLMGICGAAEDGDGDGPNGRRVYGIVGSESYGDGEVRKGGIQSVGEEIELIGQ